MFKAPVNVPALLSPGVRLHAGLSSEAGKLGKSEWAQALCRAFPWQGTGSSEEGLAREPRAQLRSSKPQWLCQTELTPNRQVA